MENKPSENKQDEQIDYELTTPTAVEPMADADAHETAIEAVADTTDGKKEKEKRRWTTKRILSGIAISLAGLGAGAHGINLTIHNEAQKPMYTHAIGTVESMEPVGHPMPDKYGVMHDDYIAIHFVTPDGTHVTAYAAESLTHGVTKGAEIDANMSQDDENHVYLSGRGGFDIRGGQ